MQRLGDQLRLGGSLNLERQHGVACGLVRHKLGESQLSACLLQLLGTASTAAAAYLQLLVYVHALRLHLTQLQLGSMFAGEQQLLRLRFWRRLPHRSALYGG